jgi:hypothetical protein
VWGFGQDGAQKKKEPAKLPGFGQPELVSKSAEGYAMVRFKDLGIVAELPGWPEVATQEWDEGDELTTKAWAGYDFESRYMSGDAYVYEAVDEEGFDPEEYRDDEVKSYEDTRYYSNVKAEKRELTVDGKKVFVVDISYLSGVDEAFARCLTWSDGQKVGMLRLTWWKDEAGATKIADHVEKSLRFN